MKALVLEKKLKLALRDIDLPTEIGPDDVKIKMHMRFSHERSFTKLHSINRIVSCWQFQENHIARGCVKTYYESSTKF